MKSTGRILLTALLGATVFISIFLAVDMRGQTSAPSDKPVGLFTLRGSMPVIEPEPSNTHPQYSREWWLVENEAEKWRAKYPEAILLVFPANTRRPVYTLDGTGSAGSVQVVPLWKLPLYAAAMTKGDVVWCPLAEAISALEGKNVADPSGRIAELEAKNKKLRGAVDEALRGFDEAIALIDLLRTESIP